jgi:hypothetical protein
MATSTIPAVIAWLVETVGADAAIGGADPPVVVSDGPRPDTDEAASAALWIGVDDPGSSAPTAATASQSWAGIGAYAKNELLSIPCTIRVWSGANDFVAARAAAFAILGAVENILRAHASLGGTVLVTLDGLTGIRLRQQSNAKGVIVDLAFQIDAKSRI